MSRSFPLGASKICLPEFGVVARRQTGRSDRQRDHGEFADAAMFPATAAVHGSTGFYRHAGAERQSLVVESASPALTNWD